MRAAIPVVIVLLAVFAAACGGSAGPSGSAGGSGSAAPSVGPVGTPDAAVAAIRARVPLFDGIGPRDPDLIGQGSFWEAEAADATWRITFEVGWGDCQAGCIDRHDWTWDVAQDGDVTFVAEEGSLLTENVLAGLHAASTSIGVGGRATGGPTCPVEQPGDAACAPRMVGGAVLVVRGADNAEAARFTTDGSGLYRIALGPGDYTLEAAPVEGYMNGPAPQPFTVAPGAETWVDLAYDTGMR